MELTIREAATLMGLSPRTVRAQAARGEIPAVKRGGRWFVRHEKLPLTQQQRRAVQARAAEVRATIDQALPSRHAARTGQRRRSVLDLEAFRLALELRQDVRARGGSVPGVAKASDELARALHALAAASAHYDQRTKRNAVDAARDAIAAALTALLLDCADPLADPVFAWVQRIEGELLPAVGGFGRWVDRLPRGRP